MKNYPLLDKDFLNKLDQQKNKILYAKIISLTFDEFPIEEITGKVTGGSINIDGTSAIRRSCSVSLIAEDVNINDYYWGVNTKFQLYIGIENHIDDQYDKIIWFKQGIFLITSFSTSLQLNGYNISIQGKDKMCLLNGDISGNITSLTVDFGKYDQIDSNGNIVTRSYQIKEILKEAIHQYAQEPYGNIIIKDLDMSGLELMEYRGNIDMFLLIKDDIVTGYKFEDEDSNESEYYIYINDSTTPTENIFLKNIPIYDDRISKEFGEESNIIPTKVTTLEQFAAAPKSAWTVARIQYGDTCGYRETELTYPKDLISNINESITQSLLDKIVQMLGEYEYFYDIDGHFVFQRKATYNNNSWNSIQNSTDPDDLYVENAAYTSALTYSFLDSNLITAFQNTPNITNLKNDFAIWGTKKSGDNEIPIHLRYAIDDKPKYYKSFSGKTYLTIEEYQRLQALDLLQEDQNVIIISNQSRFKQTPLPEGLSEKWWEIDDWTRRFLYFCDVNNEHDINYYLNLTGQDIFDIVSQYIQEAPDENVHDFHYYVYQLRQQLKYFATEWATEDWLNVFPKPSNANDSYYYAGIERAAQYNRDYWAWLIDTNYSDETGKEYIVSIEHGSATTNIGDYPTSTPGSGCGHSFDFALSRKQLYGDRYRVYFYNPTIPDTLKDDTTFIEKEETSEEIITTNNYFICDWREIIYQMAYDYYHYQHNDNYNAMVAQNNKNYYPDGVTKYEQYYIDIYGFWRDLYNPFPESINSHIVDMSLPSLYKWENNKFTELSLESEENVIISKPQEVVDEDGLFYYVTGKDKYTPYVVSTSTQEYYSYELFKDLSKIKYDPAKTYIKHNGTSSSVCEDIGYKQVNLTLTSYRSGYYWILDNLNNFVLDPEYKQITFSNELIYLPNKYYIFKNGKYVISDKKTIDNNETYYIRNSFDENQIYYEKSIYFQLGYKYYTGESWQKVNNFGAGIHYYTQNYYQLSLSGKYKKNEDGTFEKDNNATVKYEKVANPGPNVEIGYEEEIYVDPNIDYYELLTTTSMNIYSKVTSFMKGKRYYKKNGNNYEYDDSVIFELNKVYFIKRDDNDREIINLIEENKNNYYCLDIQKQDYINESTFFNSSNHGITKGSQAIFFPGEIYYCYYKQNYNNLDNGYYYLKGQYYYLSTSEVFNSNQTYYSDIYGTVAAITREQYAANLYYLKGNNNQKMFTKYNILHRFKKGYEYYIIENENNKSLIYDKNYLLATFYPREETIFYILNGKDFIPITLTQTEFNNRGNTEYYLAYGKYNYYCYTDNILNHLILIKKPYNPNAIYYKKDNSKTYKQNYVGQLAENNWNNTDYYELTSAITFELSTSYESGVDYYLFPTLNTYNNNINNKLENLEEEDWTEDLYKLVNPVGIYLKDNFNIKTYWSSLTKNPESLIFWFDFLDVSNGGDLAQYSAHLIGNRPKSINDKDVRSIYYRDVPTVIFKDNNSAYVKVFINEEKFNSAGTEKNPDIYYIYDSINNSFIAVTSYSEELEAYIINKDGTTTDVGSNNYYETINTYAKNNNSLIKKYEPTEDYYRRWNYTQDGQTGYTYVNIISAIDNLFSISSQKKSAFDILDNFLYNNSYCTETISITAIPIYHLSPNTRILVRDDKTGINGEYIVSKISLPLTYNGTMNISATKAVKRIY